MQWFQVSATTTMFYESLEALGQGLLKLVVNQPMNRDILLVGGGKRKLNNGNSCVSTNF